jgi:catechol 2,3-dioxygenase-like lactoylglutathione lyase family enzyme
MIGYVTLGTDDLERARAFYDALFETIGARRLMQLDDQHGFTLYGKDLARPSVVIMQPYDGQPANPGNGNMIALAMRSKEQVDAFHAKALALGGSDEGAPGYRGDPKRGNYFAYFRDLDGHKFAAFTIAPQG